MESEQHSYHIWAAQLKSEFQTNQSHSPSTKSDKNPFILHLVFKYQVCIGTLNDKPQKLQIRRYTC